MLIHRGFVAVGLAVIFTTAAAAAAPRSGRLNSSRYSIEGTVVQVHHDRRHRRDGWIRIHRHHHWRYAHRRGTSMRAAVSNRQRSGNGGWIATFPVNGSTRFERQGGIGNGGGRGGLVSFHNVHVGEHIRVFPGSGQQRVASVVDILNWYHRRRNHAYGNSYSVRRGYGNRYGGGGGGYGGRGYGYGGRGYGGPRWYGYGYPRWYGYGNGYRQGYGNGYGFRRGYGNGYGYNPGFAYRHPLMGSRVLARLNQGNNGQGNNGPANRPSVQSFAANRSLRHSLIQGRAAARHTRQTVAAQTTTPATKTTVKNNNTNNKTVTKNNNTNNKTVAKSSKPETKSTAKNNNTNNNKNNKSATKNTTPAKHTSTQKNRPPEHRHPPVHHRRR